MMITRFSVAFYPRKDKANQAGVAPIYMRITINGIRADYSLKVKIPLNKWDKDRQCAKGVSGDSLRVNQEIQLIRNRVFDIKTRCSIEGRELTTNGLIDLLDNPNGTTKTIRDAVRSQYERVLNLVSTSFSEATATRYNTIIRHMDDFIPAVYNKNDILLCDLDYQFAENYTTYLRTVRKCNHNSTMKYMKMLKAVIHYAQKTQWINSDPFRDFECPIEKTETVFLTRDELLTIEKKHLAIDRIKTIRDIFVFACYTGLSYVDITELTNENFVQHNEHKLVRGKRQKTNEQYIAFLLPQCVKILEMYRDNPLCSVRGTLFPVPSNQKMNAYLKELADICGITKNLTFHVSRRTFATTVALANNVSTEVIQAVLGHSNIKTTQIYAKTTEEMIINQFSKI